MDPIEAEAQALLLGAKLARALNLQDVNFLQIMKYLLELLKLVLDAFIQDIGPSDLLLLYLQKPHKG